MADGLFCVSLLAFQDDNLTHNACLIRATSHLEAVGKSLLLAHRIFPTISGWRNHHVAVKPYLAVDDPHKVEVDNA